MSFGKPAITKCRRGAALIAALLGALLLATCFEVDSIECPTGIVCPADMKCAVNQAVCIQNDCGNDVRDSGEVCDDGNIIDGDGCSAECDSDESCGNGVTDETVGETCDDGDGDNTDNCPDGEDGTCLTAVCGDGFGLLGVEACDDGNDVDDDACRNDCKLPSCGDSVLQFGEDCDDGDKDNSDTCPDGDDGTCKAAVCGDGHRHNSEGGTEECDDGDEDEGDGCDSNCTFSGCGNNIQDGTETCDDGGMCSDGTTFCVKDADCTGIGTGLCEPQGGDGCSANCGSGEECGNEETDIHIGEVCDDGKHCGDRTECDEDDECIGHQGVAGDDELCLPRDGDGCSADCRSGEACGNQILDPGEQCDDGDHINTDDCPDGDGGTCRWNLCGDEFVDLQGTTVGVDLEECDEGDNTNTCDADCTDPLCGDGFTNPVYDPPESPAGVFEQCDPGTPGFDTASCDSDCTFAYCGDGYYNDQTTEECDTAGNSVSCNADCTSASCGDGFFNSNTDAQCDDGDTSNDDNCLNNCLAAVCGDGWVDSEVPRIEECDGTGAGTGGETTLCDINCTAASCGDGDVNATLDEECDPGAPDTDTATCDRDCTIAFCGDGYYNDQTTESCDDAGNSVSCDADCSAASCGDGFFNPWTDAQCDDGDAQNDDNCTNACEINICGDGWVDQEGPATEECDGNGAGTGGETAACNVNCTTSSCGDGTVNPSDSEQCDNLGGGNSATCDSDCTIPLCDDGVENTAAAEECDDFDSDNNDYCLVGCVLNTCGDNFQCTDPVTCTSGPIDVEECDDGNAINETQCPYGTPTCTGCSTTCAIIPGLTGGACGDGAVQGADGENCDDGNTDACGGCSGDCQIPTTPAQATGSIVVLRPADFDADESPIETLTIDDGFHAPVVFEFDVLGNGITVGDVRVDISSDNNANDVRDRLRDLINVEHAAERLFISAIDAGTATVSLTHDSATGQGNQPLLTHVVDTDFAVSGMSGGAGGDCPIGMGCAAHSDCASGVCDIGVTDECVPDCGNGIPEGTEQCDDGNTNDYDGCDSSCIIEYCGDSIAQGGIGEGCDDGGTDNGDGCDEFCLIEDNSACNDTPPGLTGDDSCASGVCDTSGGAPGVCAGPCGNTTLEAGEGCDDGGTSPGDGCDQFCLVENTYACNDTAPGLLGDASCASGVCDDVGNPAPGECEPADTCGNGLLEVGEGCDDGNTTAGDGCTNLCFVENGTACNDTAPGLLGDASCLSNVCDDVGNPTPGECEPADTCGNGKIEGGMGETCDDGDIINNDMCLATCLDATCGDGVLCDDPTCTTGGGNPEVCDDHNTDACGTCDATCEVATAPVQATGSITTIVKANFDADESPVETFTLRDGYNAALVFEIDVLGNGITVGDVQVDVSGDTTADEVALTIRNAINGEGGNLLIGASAAGNTVSLLHDYYTEIGNQTNNNGVVDPGFNVTNMTNGAAGNCPTPTGCSVGEDCESNSCTFFTCDP